MALREEILGRLRDKARPQSFKELAKDLRLGKAESKKLKRMLDQMTSTGDLVLTRKGLYAPPGEINLIKGYFEAHRDGFGFVIPDSPKERDLFIPPPATMGAMNNDKVIARAEPGGKGRIIRILERAQTRIAGTVEKTRLACFVRPKSRTMPVDIYIPHKECAGIPNGQKVIVEIIEYPEDKRPPVGRIIRKLEAPTAPLEEIDAVMEELGIPHKFPAAAQEAAKALRHPEDDLLKHRKDLSRLRTVTIDGERAKDFDDAVSIEVTDLGYKLWVHIADVSHYVREGDTIDLEARDRATSVYFPDRAIPMLPKELSEDLCSLVPGKPRPAFTAEMDFDRFGKMYSAVFYQSLITSQQRMTYTEVARILAEEDYRRASRYGEKLLSDFKSMEELASAIRSRRMGRGSLDFDLPEPEVLLDMQGRPEDIIRAERNIAHIIIEEFMIAANEAVAGHLAASGVPSIYRIHEEPDPEKFEEVARYCRAVLRKRFADLRGIISAARGTPAEEFANYAVLRSLKQARYSTENVGHFGLASECYTHFTSPIRRYPDLIVHRILKEVLASGRKGLPEERKARLAQELPGLASHCSVMERNADQAEKTVLDAMKAWFMKDKAGERFEAVIVGITNYGLKVRFEDFFLEGFIHVSTMVDDYYIFDENTLVLRGRRTGRRFRIGDRVQARIDRVDMEAREILLGIGK
ncbi:MAG: ribonuclease R [Nitrospiraceae bacterium]|nr:ribonuclease R [Nitrospiraceae bacterium]